MEAKPLPVLLTRQQVTEKTGMSRATIWRHVRKGTFPPPIKMGVRTRRWLEPDIGLWLDKTIRGEAWAPPPC